MLTRDRHFAGMVIRRRLRAITFPLLLYCVSSAIGGYFIWHAVNGQRGLHTKDEYERQISLLRSELSDLDAEKARWAHRIALMKGEEIDRDLLEEEARALLGRIHKNDLVIYLPNAPK